MSNNIVELEAAELNSIVGGELFSGAGSYIGLTSGIVVGTLATNYCARTKSGIFSKIFIMLTTSFGGAVIGKVIQENQK